VWHCLHCPVFSCYGIILAWSCGRPTDTGWQHIPLSQSLSETVLKILNNHAAEESNNNKLFPYSGSRRLPCCCLLANKVENINRGQVWACSAISPLPFPWRSRLPHSTPTLAVSKHLTDTAGRTSHVELVSRPQQCRHSITSGILNIFLFRLKFVFIKHWSCQSCYIHPKHGHRLPVTWKTWNPFTWSVSEGSLESGGMILSVTLKSLYALVSHLCLTGLPEVAMPYSDMWQDCQVIFPHATPCYAKSSYWLVDPQTLHGSIHQVDHIPNGPTNSAAITTMFPLRLCGGKLLVTVTRERCYGPSRLPVNDDDDIVHCFCSRVSQSTFRRAARSVQPFHACNQQTVTLV